MTPITASAVIKKVGPVETPGEPAVLVAESPDGTPGTRVSVEFSKASLSDVEGLQEGDEVTVTLTRTKAATPAHAD